MGRFGAGELPLARKKTAAKSSRTAIPPPPRAKRRLSSGIFSRSLSTRFRTKSADFRHKGKAANVSSSFQKPSPKAVSRDFSFVNKFGAKDMTGLIITENIMIENGMYGRASAYKIVSPYPVRNYKIMSKTV
ncbi:MAG: hypothetical protein LBD37_09950 [Treponema sp.]|nr:hypothetical protein [Treponema sp.]